MSDELIPGRLCRLKCDVVIYIVVFLYLWHMATFCEKGTAAGASSDRRWQATSQGGAFVALVVSPRRGSSHVHPQLDPSTVGCMYQTRPSSVGQPTLQICPRRYGRLCGMGLLDSASLFRSITYSKPPCLALGHPSPRGLATPTHCGSLLLWHQ